MHSLLFRRVHSLRQPWVHPSVLGFALGLLALGAAPAVRAAEPGVDRLSTASGELVIQPVQHASLVLRWNQRTLLVDPVGGAALYRAAGAPELILITDIHGDHLHLPTLEAVIGDSTRLVAPPAVAEQLPEALRVKTTVLTNGAKAELAGVGIEGVAAYNLASDRQRFHAKGRGNGYVLTLGGNRVYVSGDTEDIPEMRALEDIDVAFLCMNLPFTMTVDQAAEAVRAFRPKIVYPYHCRGSDLEAFRSKVGGDIGVEVRIRDWYPAGR